MEMCGDQTIRRLVLAFCIMGLGLSNSRAFAADALSSPWSSGAKSAARLIASGTFAGGLYHAGVELKLDPGTLTYWRMPGDAGVPPVFDFGGSANLAKTEVKFPAPKRFDEGGAQIFGYQGGVIFPLDVTPKDARHPVELSLDLHYATCDQICLPATAKVTLTLLPQPTAGPEADLIAAARAEVPEVVAAKDGRGFSVSPVAAAAPSWAVRFSPAPSAAADLFAEGPEGYFFDTQRAGGFQLVLAQKPPDAKGPVPVTLTLVDGATAYQSTIRLDVTPATP